MKKLASNSMKSILLLFASLLVIVNAHAQSVTVSQLPAGSICSGTSVEFTANPIGFSGTIYYQWYLNGTAINGATGVKYTTSTLNNGDQIYVQCSNRAVSEMVPGAEFYYDATNPNSYRGASATITDLSGKGRHGTMQGFISQGNPNASWSPADGGVFNFDGVGIPLDNNQFTGQFISTGWKPSNTMSFQLAFRSLEAYKTHWNRGLISTFGLSNPVNPTIDWMGFYIGTRPAEAYALSANTNNGLHFYHDANEFGNIGTTNQTFTSTDTWYVLTVVSNAADNAGAGSIKFYLNGSTTPITTKTGKTTHAGDIVIGRSRYNARDNGDFWKGYIANVIVYNRVLSIQEIAANYNATIGKVTGASSASVISTVTSSIVLSSAAGTNSQSICNSTPITNITYATTGATGANVTGLPQGVGGNWNNNVFTISGTPTQAGTFNYEVTLTGGCNPTKVQGTMVVNLTNNTIALTSAAGTNSQSSCRNSTITNITYATTGATNATVTGLPPGVGYAFNNNVVTISGTPVPTSGTFNYTVTLTGGCGNITATGSITINSNAVPSVPTSLTGDGCANNRTTLSSTNTFTSYAWFRNGTEIPNTNSQTYRPAEAGNYYVRVYNGTCYGTSSDITINVCGITQTGKMHATEYMINTLGGAANTVNKGVDERGKIHNVPN
uniref:LamG-like jellyroll fold domain-containing protein n=1 Tax=Algoriphagus sp. TaxID=1872435 RepID=UPI004047EFD8